MASGSLDIDYKQHWWLADCRAVLDGLWTRRLCSAIRLFIELDGLNFAAFTTQLLFRDDALAYDRYAAHQIIQELQDRGYLVSGPGGRLEVTEEGRRFADELA